MTTDDERDDKVSSRYRELGGGEPPARLDDAILAASRRAVRARPGAARAPGVSRWAVPFSIAAALVLSVMVTLRMQEERPDLEAPVSIPAPAPRVIEAPAPPQDAPPAKEANPAAVAPQAGESPRRAAPEALKSAVPAAGPQRNQVAGVDAPKPAPRPMDAERGPLRDDARREPKFTADPAPVAAAPPPAVASAPAPLGELASQAPAPDAAPRSMAGASVKAARSPAASPASGSASAPATAAAQAPAEIRQRGELSRERATADTADSMAKRAIQAESPERELERIADLRREGRHIEADRLLAEFRQRYPQYRIPEAMLEKVQPPR